MTHLVRATRLIFVVGGLAACQSTGSSLPIPSTSDTTATSRTTVTSSTTTATAIGSTPSTTAADPPETDCLPTFRFDDVDLIPPLGTGAEEVEFSAEIVYPAVAGSEPVLQAVVLAAPDGTAIIEIIVNGRSRGGSSYGPGSVHGVPLRDESTALVELCAYGADGDLIAFKLADTELVVE